jgi:hypothetical protein
MVCRETLLAKANSQKVNPHELVIKGRQARMTMAAKVRKLTYIVTTKLGMLAHMA